LPESILPTTMLLLSVLAALPVLVEGLSAIPIYYDSSNALHRDIQWHSECPERITVCVQALDKYQKEQHPSPSKNNRTIQLIDVAPPEYTETATTTIDKWHQPFTDQQLAYARDMLLATHQPELVTQLEERCAKAKQQRIDNGKPPLGFVGRIDADTYVTTETFAVCLRATAAWIQAVDDAVLSDGSGSAFALTRPPGHHATYSLQNGFCLFNFCAAAALHAVTKHGLRVSILDIDVHYGQGCADIVAREHDKDNTNRMIRYASIHQTPAFPYEGETAGIAHGGSVLTLPMPADTTWTCGYADLLERALPFVCDKDDAWQPDLVLVCAGYDALANDPLASCSLNAQDYGRIVRRLCQHLQQQQQSSNHKKRAAVVLGLEGGYCIEGGGQSGNIADAVVATVQALVEEEQQQQPQDG